jgi:rod shape-determining protein MreC
MKKIKEFFTPKNVLVIMVVFCLLLAAVSLMSNRVVAPIRAVVSYVIIPMQKGMNNLGLWTSDKADTLKELSDVIDENESLQARVDELVEENNQLKQDSYELERLRDLYELDEKYPGYTKVAARVIGKGSDNWFNTFTIDKGSDDGIEVDMNVIAGGGLVGIVTSVGSNYATVHSIIDDSSRVSGMLIDTGDNCIVDGDIKLMDSGLIRIEYIKKDVVIRDGDKIVTSNISDNYLEGILIGYAKDVTMDANNLTQSGYLVPVVDFAHLQEVLVIKEKKIKS